MAKKAPKAYTYKPTTFPSRECPYCHKWYHARSKECPECGTANPGRGSVARKVKKKVRVKRRTARPTSPTAGNALDAAIEFVQVAGGINEARAALETIERIKGL